MDNFLEFVNITKKFAGVPALKNINFSIKQGEIHCFCGENGAGKSTLINLCAGVFQPEEGMIKCKGEEVHPSSPRDAEKLGIGVAFQEVPLCTNMSISANIFLGAHPKTKYGKLDWEYMNQETRKILDEFEIKRDPGEMVSELTIAEQSLIQIGRVLYNNPECIILDEPTSTLSDNQKDILFKRLRKICKEKVLTVIYVSHRMEEIFEITDRITILKDGEYVTTLETKRTNENEIVKHMVGREVTIREKKPVKVGDVALEVKNIVSEGVVDNVSFSVRKGEILGFSGLQGAGRTELARIIYGLDKKDSGDIYINGEKVKINSVKDAISHHIGLISENRRDEGIVGQMSVKNNLILVMLNEFSKLGFLKKRGIADATSEYVKKLKIKIASQEQEIIRLSGGNQQKVIIARWLLKNPQILICDEPTRGIDVGTKSEIYEILEDLAAGGMAIILISSDLPEILAVSDRIIVMKQGKISGTFDKSEATEENIMKSATGIGG